jgi:hypothetical protein
MEIHMKSTNIKTRLSMIGVLLIVVAQACRLFTPGDQHIYEAVTPEVSFPPTSGVEAPTQDESDGQKTEFPLPENISNFTDLGNGAINFQTNLSITDAIAFYRDAFSKAGYTEREINTAITDETFNLVFDGHASGKAIVVQGVDLGAGSINISIRLEDV